MASAVSPASRRRVGTSSVSKRRHRSSARRFLAGRLRRRRDARRLLSRLARRAEHVGDESRRDGESREVRAELRVPPVERPDGARDEGVRLRRGAGHGVLVRVRADGSLEEEIEAVEGARAKLGGAMEELVEHGDGVRPRAALAVGERGEERLVRATHLRLAAANLALQRFEQLGIRRGAAGSQRSFASSATRACGSGGALGFAAGLRPNENEGGMAALATPRATPNPRVSPRPLEARPSGVSARWSAPTKYPQSCAALAGELSQDCRSSGFGAPEVSGGFSRPRVGSRARRVPPRRVPPSIVTPTARASHLDTRTHDPATLSNVGRATSRRAREPRLGLTRAYPPEPTAPPWPHTPPRTPPPRPPRRGASAIHSALRPILVVSRGHLARSPRRHPGRAMRPRAGRLVRVVRVRLLSSTRGGWLPSDWRRCRPLPGVRHGQHRPFTARGGDRGRHDGGGVAMHGPAPCVAEYEATYFPPPDPGPNTAAAGVGAVAPAGPGSAPGDSSHASPSPCRLPAIHSPP